MKIIKISAAVVAMGVATMLVQNVQGIQGIQSLIG